MDTRGPALGAKIVARAWTDPEFKKRLLANGTAAVAEMSIPMGDAELIIVENTQDVHNVIVCTLCSCYPRTILGLPPDWYKSRNYRSRVVVEPRAVLKEFGTVLPDSVTLRTHDSNADMRYLVLPERPTGTEGWSQEQLAAIVTRDCMVGVAVPQVE
jgi:nitrile hydratase subunit alpha